jgi:putative PIN family toxin of toxin-antitoxin system
MKIILDTNILISGIFFKGPPFEILSAWEKNKFQLVTTHAILDEYKRVVDELSSEYPQIDTTEVMNYLALNVHLSLSITLPFQICTDPDDDKFFAAAIASKTGIIVSGDKHLLDKSGYMGIKVIRPSEFLHKYLK